MKSKSAPKSPRRGKRKKKSKTRPKREASAAAAAAEVPRVESLDPLRTGMPALDSITGVKEFRKGEKVYRLIQTNEVDEYEQPPKPKPKK
jgi:hypothetical protein